MRANRTAPSASHLSRASVKTAIALRRGRFASLCPCDEIAAGRFIGSVGIFEPLDWPEPEIAYSLDQPFWHRGFAAEAAGAARDWLFAQFPLPRAASFIRPENRASIRVAERLG